MIKPLKIFLSALLTLSFIGVVVWGIKTIDPVYRIEIIEWAFMGFLVLPIAIYPKSIAFLAMIFGRGNMEFDFSSRGIRAGRAIGLIILALVFGAIYLDTVKYKPVKVQEKQEGVLSRCTDFRIPTNYNYFMETNYSKYIVIRNVLQDIYGNGFLELDYYCEFNEDKQVVSYSLTSENSTSTYQKAALFGKENNILGETHVFDECISENNTSPLWIDYRDENSAWLICPQNSPQGIIPVKFIFDFAEFE